MKIAPNSIWQCKASKKVHKVVYVEPQEVVTVTLTDGDDYESFLGEQDQFLNEFEYMNDGKGKSK